MTTKNYFQDLKTVKDVKHLYRLLALEFHPDKHDQTMKDHYNAIMQIINEQYHNVLKSLDRETVTDELGKDHTYYYNAPLEDRVIEILRQLYSYEIPEGVTVSIVGSWVWIENVKRDHKDFIFLLSYSQNKNCISVKDDSGWNYSFKYNKVRNVWQFNPTKSKGIYSPHDNDTLKGLYGSKTLDNAAEKITVIS